MIAQEELLRSFELRSELSLDCSVFMPNHIHMIVKIERRDDGVLGYKRQALEREARSVSSFMAGYKGKVTARINTLRATPGQAVWHYRFNDHVVRTEESLYAIRNYIENNPRAWALDKLHPNAKPGQLESIDKLLEAEALRTSLCGEHD